MAHLLDDIPLKKRFGQHFLQDDAVLRRIVELVGDVQGRTVLEIGCGAGVLTRALLELPLHRLQVLEIDTDWIGYVRKHCKDGRLFIEHTDACQFDFQKLSEYAPLVLAANLPYSITFPLFFQLVAYRHLFSKIVVMVQEEVAQRFAAQRGRSCNWQSLYFQYFFEVSLDRLVMPASFYPEPNVKSRLVVFVPRKQLLPLVEPEKFWRFIRVCYAQPRRTLKNNVTAAAYNTQLLPSDLAGKRAQELSFEQLLHVWECLRRG